VPHIACFGTNAHHEHAFDRAIRALDIDEGRHGLIRLRRTRFNQLTYLLVAQQVLHGLLELGLAGPPSLR
jgi:hypothetical protein